MKLTLRKFSHHYDVPTGVRTVKVVLTTAGGVDVDYTVTPAKFDHINLVREVDKEFMDGEEESQPIAAPVGALVQVDATNPPPTGDKAATEGSDVPALPVLEPSITIEDESPKSAEVPPEVQSS